MANTAATVKVYPDKLRMELNKRMLVPAEVSREIGLNSAYLSKTFSKGSCNQAVVLLLEKRYGIEPSSYVIRDLTNPAAMQVLGIEESPMKSIEQYIPMDRLSRKELTEIIFNAVYQATKDSFENALPKTKYSE